MIFQSHEHLFCQSEPLFSLFTENKCFKFNFPYLHLSTCRAFLSTFLYLFWFTDLKKKQLCLTNSSQKQNNTKQNKFLCCLTRVNKLSKQFNDRSEILNVFFFSQLTLAKVCGSKNPLGLESKTCSHLVSQLFSPTHPASRHCTQGLVTEGINDAMR